MPFGEVRAEIGTISQTDFSFTGQRSISMLSIMDYIARNYDPGIGRFLQPDTIVPSVENPQAFNRYSYVMNSPVNLNDPTGHWSCHSDSNYRCRIRYRKYLNAGLEACTSEAHYCMLFNGAVIDVKHYMDEEAAYFWDQLLKAKNGLRSTVTLTAPAGIWTFSATYTVNVAGMNKDQLAQVGAGIWWSFQFRFEMWEGTLGLGLGKFSTFDNEDITATFLAYVAETHGGEDEGWGFDDVMGKLGAVASTAVDAGGARESTIRCVNTGICDSYTPKNSSIYLKVIGADGYWTFVPYPQELSITPITDPAYFTYLYCSTNSGTVC